MYVVISLVRSLRLSLFLQFLLSFVSYCFISSVRSFWLSFFRSSASSSVRYFFSSSFFFLLFLKFIPLVPSFFHSLVLSFLFLS